MFRQQSKISTIGENNKCFQNEQQGLCAFVKENREANETILNMLNNELLDDIEEAVGVIADHDTVEDFCEEIKNIIVVLRPEIAKILLESMIEYVLDPLAEDDFWGTEG